MASRQRFDAFIASPASFIDHTLLKPTATASQIKQLCAEARQYKFKTVCVNTRWIPLCVAELHGSETIPIAVVGFPLGACATQAKVREFLRPHYVMALVEYGPPAHRWMRPS